VLWADQKGASSVEYLLALVLVALVTLGAWVALGDATRDEARCVATAISTGAAGPCGAAAHTAPGEERAARQTRGLASTSAALSSDEARDALEVRDRRLADFSGGDDRIGVDHGAREDVSEVREAVAQRSSLAAERYAEVKTAEDAAHDCDGWTDFECHIANAAGWVYESTQLDLLVDKSGLDTAVPAVGDWLARNVYDHLGPLRPVVDFVYGLAISGPIKLVTGTVDGVGRLLDLGGVYLQHLIDDPIGTVGTTLRFLYDPIYAAHTMFPIAKGLVAHYADKCSSAVGAGECTFDVALTIASFATTGGGASVVMHGDDVAPLLTTADDVARAADEVAGVLRTTDAAVLDDVRWTTPAATGIAAASTSGELLTATQWADRVLDLPRPILIATDVDGTIAPIQRLPDLAAVPDATQDALLTIAGSPDARLAFVTGRDADSLAGVIEVPGSWRAVEHGRTVVAPGETVPMETLATADRAALDSLRSWATGEAAPAGAWVEEKPASIAIHVRRLAERSPEEAERLLAAAEQQARRLGLEVRPGRSVVEVGVDLGRKDLALDELMERTGARSVIYLGDDVTDFDAIARANELGGLGIVVRSAERATDGARASGSIAGTDEVSELLRLVARGLEAP